MVAQHTFISQYDGLLADLDGTVWKGKDAIPHAVETIAALAELSIPVVYVTNNSSRSPETVTRKLASLGFSAAPEDVVTSAEVTVDAVVGSFSQDARVLVVGSDYLKEACQHAGLRVVESYRDSPDAVIQGYNADTTWGQLSEAVLSISQGAQFFITNSDQTLPTERGLEIGNGGMARVVADCAGAHWISSGKPQPDICREGARRHHMTHPLVVGDRLSTDIGAGLSSGCDTLLVLTGVTRLRDLINPLPKDARPTYVAPDLSALLLPQENLTLNPSGGLSTEVTGHTLLVHGGTTTTTSLDVLKTVLSATWQSKEAVFWGPQIPLFGDPGDITDVDADTPAVKDLLEALW